MAWLDNSRILATYAVVLLHVTAGFVVNNDVGTEYWWVGNIYDSAVRWCVPVFVMVSGALLLDSNKKEDLLTFYKKRFSRILIPLLTWSVFFLVWDFFKSTLNGSELSITDLLKSVLSGTPHYHMWFLYMILSLYLFSPFFRKIAANSSKKELIFLISISFIFSALNFAYEELSSGITQLFINWFLFFIPYFFLGYFIRLDNNPHSIVFLWTIFLFSLILTSMGCYIVAIKTDLKTGMYFYGYLSISVIPMSISLMYLLKTWNKPILNASITKKLSILTLGIYLIHPILLETINDTQYNVLSFHPIISIPVVAFIIFIVSLGMSWLIYQVPYLRRTI